MKTKMFFLGIFMLLTGFGFSQSGFNFKALVADGSGNPLSNQLVNLKISIKQGSTLVWQEEHAGVSTDAYGIVSVVMGTGNKTGGSAATFDEVQWYSNDMNYSVEVDTGSGYQLLVENEAFESMPYAKMADKIRGVQDKVNIGASSSRKLQVTGEATSTELVEFEVTNVLGGYDVLQLVLPSSADNGDFIEARKGNSIIFNLDYEGNINTDGYIKADNYIRTDGDLVVLGKVKNSISSTASNMLPVAWGSVYSYGIVNVGSDNFTVNKVGTGAYRITINGISDYSDAVIIANPGPGALTFFVRSYNTTTYLYVGIRDTSDNPQDANFNFVVFKK